LCVAPSAPAFAELDVTVSPRTWLFFDDVAIPGGAGEGPSGNPFVSSQDPFFITMYGGSLSVRSTEFLPDTTFTITGLYGEDDENRVNLGGAINDTSGGGTEVVFTENRNKQDLERFDFEFTAQTRFNDYASWMVGGRWERVRVDFDSRNQSGAGQSVNPVTPGNPQPGFVRVGQGKSDGESGYDIFSGRIGLAGSVPLTKSRKHLLYSNVLFFLGRQIQKNKGVTQIYESRWLGGPDLAVGYIFALTPSISFDLRYRALFFYPFSGSSDFDSPEVTHGLNIGLNFQIPSSWTSFSSPP